MINNQRQIRLKCKLLIRKQHNHCANTSIKNPHSTKYPRLSVIAKRVLTVPATSVPSEEIFSSAGLIVTRLRTKLSSEVVDQIIFLNKNKIKVPRNEPHLTD
jgi:hypothetical protein